MRLAFLPNYRSCQNNLGVQIQEVGANLEEAEHILLKISLAEWHTIAGSHPPPNTCKSVQYFLCT